MWAPPQAVGQTDNAPQEQVREEVEQRPSAMIAEVGSGPKTEVVRLHLRVAGTRQGCALEGIWGRA